MAALLLVTRKNDKDELRPEYDFSHGVRGKHYYEAYRAGTNVVFLDPDTVLNSGTGSADLFCWSAALPPITTKSPGLQRQVPATLLVLTNL